MRLHSTFISSASQPNEKLALDSVVPGPEGIPSTLQTEIPAARNFPAIKWTNMSLRGLLLELEAFSSSVTIGPFWQAVCSLTASPGKS